MIERWCRMLNGAARRDGMGMADNPLKLNMESMFHERYQQSRFAVKEKLGGKAGDLPAFLLSGIHGRTPRWAYLPLDLKISATNSVRSK